MLILYSSILQNVLAHSNSFLFVLVFDSFWWFPIYKVMLSQNSNSLTSFQPEWMFAFFSVFIALTRISSTVLIKSGEREHPSLVLGLRSFSTCFLWLYCSLSAYYKGLLCCISIPNFSVLLSWKGVEFYHTDVIMKFTVLHFVGLVSQFINLNALNHLAFVKWIPLGHSKYAVSLFCCSFVEEFFHLYWSIIYWPVILSVYYCLDNADLMDMGLSL